DVLRQAQVFVEYALQTRIEGDIQQLAPDFAVTELWEVLAGQHGGRSSDAAVTVFDSVGFALEDFSALRFLRDAAAELGMGQPIELIPQLSDPKNLFGLLRERQPLLRAAA
ncbi:MAG TPA: ornithine cyclodeaminase, partial [Acidovorax sp.]|nr:ornithine cyclodeaminase [Acidovorax sp.]